MWWSDRRALLTVLGGLALTACGFAPAYGPVGGAQALQGAISLPGPTTRAEYLMVQRLEQRLGRARSPVYLLTTTLSVFEQGLGTNDEGDTTRFQKVGAARFVLTRSGDDAPVLEGETQAFTGYSATGSTVATLSSERDAEQRLMEMLADQIVDRLILAAKELGTR